MKMFSLPIILLAITLLSPQLASAIVNVGQSVTDVKTDGMSHILHFGLDGAQGNTDKDTFKADLLSQWRHGQYTEFLMLDRAYGKSSGAVNTDRAFVHLRHRTQINEAWAGEVFAQKGRDKFTRLSDRTLLGGGGRLRVIEEEGVSGLYVGLGAIYEWEKLSPTLGTSDTNSQLWRGNMYVMYKHQINDQVQVSSTTYIQPTLQNSSDYRLLEQAAFTVGMFENVKLKISVDYSFDAKPPQTIGKDDVRYSSGLELRF
ncbi:MAG: hypothetical protein AUK35_05990 [Zetaproteobacteria bacterium CG2_30_46_52]|nr:MAG: hypothetical protein AUK35_05990 [Zetaproteobacteria bacterium CG2_30_46_52]